MSGTGFRAASQTADVVLHPGLFRVRKTKESEFRSRLRKQQVIAIDKISLAISELKHLRCDENGAAVDILMSELRLALDEIGFFDHRNLSNMDRIFAVTIRLKYVAAGLDILKGSETLRHLRSAINFAYGDQPPDPSSLE